MGLKLLSLLQQISGELPPVGGAPSGSGPDITVEGNTQPPRAIDTQGPASPFMGNRDYLNEAAMANNSPLPDEVQRQRRGLFGTRGTLRNVLGTLGDALLTANGGQATYAPQRRQERLADAMVGYTNSPEAAMAAVERVTQIDPEAGRVLYEQIQNDALRNAQIEASRASSQSTENNRLATRSDNAFQNIARMFQSPNAQENGVISPRAYAMAQRIANGAGISLERLGITPDMSAEDMALLSQTDLSVFQAINQPLNERRVAATEANVVTGRINATRPRAEPRAAQPTNASEVARIRAAINRGERLAPGDQATWDAEMRRLDASAPRPNRPASSQTGPVRRLVMPPRGN